MWIAFSITIVMLDSVEAYALVACSVEMNLSVTPEKLATSVAVGLLWPVSMVNCSSQSREISDKDADKCFSFFSDSVYMSVSPGVVGCIGCDILRNVPLNIYDRWTQLKTYPI